MTFVNSSSVPSGNPVFDYTSRDYTSIFNDLVNRIPVYLPEWTSTSPSDFGIVMLQLFAYMGDNLGYYLDRLAGEAFIQTATQPSSIINLATMLGYTPALAASATTSVTVTIGPSVQGPIVLPFGTTFSTTASPTQNSINFQTTQTVTIAGAGGTTPSFTAQIPVIQSTTYTSLPIGYGSINVWDEFDVPSTATVTPSVAVSSGTINQIYPLLYSPVAADSFSVYVDLGLGPQEWTYATSLISAAPTDYVYTNYVDANGIFYVVFGDGINGYVPPLGSPIYATYDTTLGFVGNVGANTINNSLNGIVGLTSVNNSTGASGGADAESIASIQQNAPASLRSLNRGVTLNDIETLALVPGVQWASVIEQTYQLVNLYIAPQGGGVPTPQLQSNVLNYISPLMMPNTTVTIFSPTYVPINIVVELVVLEPYGNETVQNLVQNALQNFFNLSNTGFGDRVSLGEVYQIILTQPGVDYAIVGSMNRQFLATLNVPLENNTAYATLTTTPLPQPVYGGDLLTLTNLPLSYLTAGLTSGNYYTSIQVTELSQPVTSGDSITVSWVQGGATQVLQANGNVAAGGVSIPVVPFVAAYTFPVGSTATDVTTAPNTQTNITVAGGIGMVAAQAGSTSIPVEFTTTDFGTGSQPAFQVGAYVQDLSGANDCVLLENEIPVYGTVTFSPPTTGGLIGS